MARARFLSTYAASHGPQRGIGSINVRRAGQGGGARVRWGANAESLAVVGYVGPSRALDASIRGESFFLVIRRYDMGVQGLLRGEEGVSGALLRFLGTPWDFSPEWARPALEHASIRESGSGWLLEGSLLPGGSRSSASSRRGADTTDIRFTLELSARGEPARLVLRRADAEGPEIQVRYGPERNFEAGRIPSWIEWTFSGSVVLLKLEDHAPADASKIRYVTRVEPGWTILDIDEPGGRALIRWLLGTSEGRAGP